MDDYIEIAEIGEGSYGVVYKAKHKETEQIVALKSICFDNTTDGIPYTTLREIAVLKTLQHQNIVLLKDIIVEKCQLYMVLDFVCQDLRTCINATPDGHFMDHKLIKNYMKQILQAIDFCHTRRVLHRDLKPENILITSKGIVKVTDFGLARTVSIPVRTYTHQVVTLHYRAPELLLGADNYFTSVDIWSIGCIFAELMTNNILFRGSSEINQLVLIFSTLTTPNEETWPGITALLDSVYSYPTFEKNRLWDRVKPTNTSAFDLLQKTLLYNPQCRITTKKALMHPYFLT